jgi:hydrogenase expression/formation protein HypC
MCLGIPGRIVRIDDGANMTASVDVCCVRRQINISCIVDYAHSVDACVGDWVLVHVGFAMSRIDAAETAERLKILTELGAMQPELESIRASDDALTAAASRSRRRWRPRCFSSAAPHRATSPAKSCISTAEDSRRDRLATRSAQRIWRVANFAALLDRLGLAEEMQPKTKLVPPGGKVSGTMRRRMPRRAGHPADKTLTFESKHHLMN